MPGDATDFWCVAFTPGDNQLVTASSDGRLRWWDASARNAPGTLVQHETYARCIEATPDGNRIFVGWGDGLISRGEPLSSGASGFDLPPIRFTTYKKLSAPILDLAIDPTGAFLAVKGHQLSVLHQKSGDVIWTKHIGGGWNAHLDISADGRFLLSGGLEEPLRLWNLRSGELLREYFIDGQPAQLCLFSADGRQILASAAGNLVQLDRDSGVLLRRFRSGPGQISDLECTLGRNLIAITTWHHGVELWSSVGKRLQIWPGLSNSVSILAFSPDGRSLATSGNGSVTVWHIASGQPVLEFPSDPNTEPYRLVFAQNGQRLLGAGVLDKIGEVRSWDAPQLLPPLPGGNQ
jgi:WD40 repeat protein